MAASQKWRRQAPAQSQQALSGHQAKITTAIALGAAKKKFDQAKAGCRRLQARTHHHQTQHHATEPGQDTPPTFSLDNSSSSCFHRIVKALNPRVFVFPAAFHIQRRSAAPSSPFALPFFFSRTRATRVQPARTSKLDPGPERTKAQQIVSPWPCHWASKRLDLRPPILLRLRQRLLLPSPTCPPIPAMQGSLRAFSRIPEKEDS